LIELKRLVHLAKAYQHMNRGDELLTENKTQEAMKAYATAMDMVPDNAEMIFWPAVTMASTGLLEESLPLFKKAFALYPNWALLVPRLPKVGQLPKNEALINRILSVVPQKKSRE
jgi:tetratricopeptide (TPR) repeat protein